MSEYPLVRPALVSECDRLTQMAFESKRAWGYDEQFMERCRGELVVTAREVERGNVFVAGDGRQSTALGFYVLLANVGGLAQLDMLFVEPSRWGEGFGARLWLDAVRLGRLRGAETLRVESDPFAVGFYERLGAVNVGVATSPSTGRTLPVLELSL